jgi:hypothetical protein
METGFDGGKLAELLLNAINAKNWALVTVVGLVLVVWITRKYGSKWFPVLEKPWASVALAFGYAMGAALLTALVAGTPMSLGLIATSILTALAAMGTWSGSKALAESAGYNAANKVNDTKDAIKTIGK